MLVHSLKSQHSRDSHRPGTPVFAHQYRNIRIFTAHLDSHARYALQVDRHHTNMVRHSDQMSTEMDKESKVKDIL